MPPLAHADAPHGHASATRYVIVWILLCIGTIATFLVAQGEHTAWSLPIALLIATTKASLVAMIFMHLWGDKGLPKVVLLTALVLFILVISLVLTDLHFRFALVTPRGLEVPVPPRVLEWKL